MTRRLARWGESVAAGFLERRGAVVVERNVRVGRGEIDLIVRFDTQLVAVEVKTVGPGAVASDPIERIDVDKMLRVRRLANQWTQRHRQRIRVDFVGVLQNEQGVAVNWRTAVA